MTSSESTAIADAIASAGYGQDDRTVTVYVVKLNAQNHSLALVAPPGGHDEATEKNMIELNGMCHVFIFVSRSNIWLPRCSIRDLVRSTVFTIDFRLRPFTI